MLETKDAQLNVLLGEMKEYGEANHIPIINVNGLRVLVEAVASQRAHNVLEIGTAIGYSALYIAANSAEDVRITTLELDKERASIARGYIDRSRYKNQISIITGDAGENLLKLAAGKEKYDLVFIDAAKGQYPDYFRKLQPMLTDNAMIIADNVLFRDYVLGKAQAPRRFRTIVKRLREYIKMVTEESGFETVIYENGDGLAVSRRK